MPGRSRRGCGPAPGRWPSTPTSMRGRRVAEQHERLLDTVGALVQEWAGRWGFEFRLPPREVVRGIYAISRGMGLEALLADDPRAADQFEEMFLAYAMGLISARPDT